MCEEMIDYLTSRVSLSTSHSIQDQLLSFHAHLWLHLWYGGCVIWKITYKTWRIAPCVSFDTSSNATVYLSSEARICLLSLQTLHIQMVRMDNVTSDMFYNVNMDLWSCDYSWEESIQQSQCPRVVPKFKIQVSNIILLTCYPFIFYLNILPYIIYSLI